MLAFIEALSRVLPVILLFLLGTGLYRTQFIRAETIQDLKKIVINLTLPAVLFLAFAGVSLEGRHFIIVAIIFTACILALLIGRLIRPLSGIDSFYFPALMTGFEAGMLGYAIFGSVYGPENIYKFGIIDLGQVTFVFFILVTILERYSRGSKPFSATLINFFKTPVILSILLGILANRSGWMPVLSAWPLSASALRTLELLAALTTPLVALVIGYEMRMQRGNLLKPFSAIGARLLLWVPVGILLNLLVIDRLLELDPIFQAAVMTMVILPPPFIIPIFMTGADENDRAFVGNALSIATLITLFLFALVSIIYVP